MLREKRKQELDEGDLAVLEALDDEVVFQDLVKALEETRGEEEGRAIRVMQLDELSDGREAKIMVSEGDLPDSGVYIIFRENKVYYIGQSSNLKSRLTSHHWGFGSQVAVIECPDTLERLSLEAALIRRIKPPVNVACKK